MSTSHTPTNNRLLSSLSGENLRHLLSGCEQIELSFGSILSKPEEAMHHVYFPTDSFISLVMPIDGGSGLEVALIGNEGMYGIPLLLGVAVSPMYAVVQGAGPAWRMDMDSFHKELKLNIGLQQDMNRYVYVSMKQLAQTAACNRFHLVEARLARWLLMTRDRAHADEFHITHEFLAQMLGVRRVGVTKAAGALQNKGLIHYHRGHIQIQDLAGLEAASCSCYQSDKNIYADILHC